MRTIAAVLLLALVSGCGDARKEMLVRRKEKIGHVKAIVAALAASGNTLPMKDGALDVYALVQSGAIRQAAVQDWPDPIPSEREIGRGDYARFPYERYRGRAELHGRYPVPLVWDKEPDSAGILVVGMSDGEVKTMYKADFQREFGG